MRILKWGFSGIVAAALLASCVQIEEHFRMGALFSFVGLVREIPKYVIGVGVFLVIGGGGLTQDKPQRSVTRRTNFYWNAQKIPTWTTTTSSGRKATADDQRMGGYIMLSGIVIGLFGASLKWGLPYILSRF
jgi:hypothetical protein